MLLLRCNRRKSFELPYTLPVSPVTSVPGAMRHKINSHMFQFDKYGRNYTQLSPTYVTVLLRNLQLLHCQLYNDNDLRLFYAVNYNNTCSNAITTTCNWQTYKAWWRYSAQCVYLIIFQRDAKLMSLILVINQLTAQILVL